MSTDTASALVRSLQSASAFPHAITAIEVHETHISWVVLTGPFAYKIKKPVNLGFVDFASLSRRRFFCEEELRLNRRLASNLYLDVLPICGTEHSPRVGGTGPPLEWCVRMRQFDQDCLLNRLIERGALAPEHIDALVRQIVEFHARIPFDPPGSPFGTPAAIAEPVRANFSHFEEVESAAENGLVVKLREWCEAELKRLEGVFTARKRGGFIRECHGDMHLGNMILVKEAIIIFDCIEFSESLRWIDVMSEIAFCTMDLADYKRTDLAWRFLNATLEWSGDYGSLAVFPFYFTYRALVRAKVARIRQDQVPIAERHARQSSSAFSNYLSLAGSSLQKRPRFLAITHGLSGSGKTQGTQAVLEHFGAIRLRSDVERKRLAGIGPLVDSGSEIATGLYSPEFNRRTISKLAELSAAIIAYGFPVIIDATFLKRSERDQFRALAESLDVPFVIVDFPTDEATCRERVWRRRHEKGDASEATEEVLDRQVQFREPLGDQEQRVAVRVDSKRPKAIKEVIPQIDRVISERGPAPAG